MATQNMTNTINNEVVKDYVTATTQHIIDKIIYIVIARSSETARITIHAKIDSLIFKEVKKLADKLAMLTAS